MVRKFTLETEKLMHSLCLQTEPNKILKVLQFAKNDTSAFTLKTPILMFEFSLSKPQSGNPPPEMTRAGHRWRQLGKKENGRPVPSVHVDSGGGHYILIVWNVPLVYLHAWPLMSAHPVIPNLAADIRNSLVSH